MPRKRNNGLSEEKRNIIGQLVEMYDIKNAADIQEALKDLLGGTIQSMLETELSTQMQEQEEADPEYRDSRNGYKPKSLKSSMGESRYPCHRIETVILSRRSCRSTRGTSRRSRARSSACMRAE